MTNVFIPTKEEALESLKIAVRNFMQAHIDKVTPNKLSGLYGIVLSKMYFCSGFEDERALELIRQTLFKKLETSLE